MKRMFSLALTAALASLLAGCAGIPTSGPVKPGSALAVSDTSTIEFFPSGPARDATQEQILRGFLEAASGPQNDYAVAKQFLTPEFQTKWDPNASVSIDSSVREVDIVPTNTASVTSTVSAIIDATGQYSELATATERISQYSFALVNGQWRLSAAPQGILLERSIFDLIFRSYPIYFYDPSFRFLVPDVRWFARASSATTRVTKALLSGPAPWLAAGNAVVTAFPAQSGLVINSVPVLKDVAMVDLTSVVAASDPVTVTRMKQQLAASLVGVNSVSSVEMFVEGVPLGQAVIAYVDTALPPPVDSRAFVVSERGVGFLDGDTISPVPTVTPYLTGNYSAVTLGQGNRLTATLSSEGVGVVRPGGGYSLIDNRPNVIAPALDRYNFVWSVPRAILSELRATAPDGSSTTISVPWSASSVIALEVAHDGARVAVLFTDSSQAKLVVASVIRGENGVPLRLGGTVNLPVPSGTPMDIAWVDGTTVAVLSNSGSSSVVFANVIGGRSQTLPSVFSGTAVSIAGGNTLGQLRMLNADGRLFTARPGTSWASVGTGIKVLGTLQ